MSSYKSLAEKALQKALLNSSKKTTLNESVVYPEGMHERMHPKLERELFNQKHSLGKHPAFPEGDEDSFEQRIMGERFSEVCKRFKRAFDTDRIENESVKKALLPMVKETMEIESKHKKKLQELAIRMIREEYDMDEDTVEIVAELTPEISLEGAQLNPKPMPVKDMQFETHEDMVNANSEVYKRRFLNAMTQGAAKKCNHMFHMVDEELTDIDPRLPNKYAKLMSAADYTYYIVPDLEEAVSGGVVRVEYPTNDNPKVKIHAQAMVVPVLVHEIVKGVMELLSAHGLPKDKKMFEYVTNKADFLAAEPWDMRIGPAIWGRFTEAIDSDDFNLKHHVYSELAALPAKQFHEQMKEILAGTKRGRKIVKDIIENVKNEMQEEDYNNALDEFGMNEDDDDIDLFL